MPAALTKEGHEFKGWYLGEELYDFENEVKSSITLTAKWEKEADQSTGLAGCFGSFITSLCGLLTLTGATIFVTLKRKRNE